MTTIQVVLADDHQVMRASIRDLLEKVDDIEVVGEADNGTEALHLVEASEPDVLLLDMEMPGLKGAEVARRLQEKGSGVRILALSAYDDRQYILSMLNSGAAGYLIKGESFQTILEAIRGVAEGEEGWVSQRVAAQLAAWTKEKAGRLTLTKREVDVLQLLVAGQTDQEIGSALDISEKRVNELLKSLFVKLGVSSRVAAGLRAVQEGLV
jgi:DNA-binding NarL/FixJ family response regulator